MKVWLHRISTTAGFLFVAAGIGLATYGPLIARNSQAYSSAPACGSLREARQVDADCTWRTPATVLASHIARGSSNPTVSVMAPGISASPITLAVDRPTETFYSLQPGTPASLKIWRGIITALYAGQGPYNAVRTVDSPYTVERLQLSEGLLVLGVGGALIFIAPPSFAVRWMRAKTRWHLGEPNEIDGSLKQAFANRHLAIPLAGFLVFQVLDVATSIKGGLVGLYEDTPTAVLLSARWGPPLAFLALKLPAILVTLLAIPRLPRRLGILVAWCGVAVMAYIVLQNAWLIDIGKQAMQAATRRST